MEVRSTQFHFLFFLFYLEKNTEWDANSAVLSSKKKHMRHTIKLFSFKNSRDEFLFCCFMNVRCKNHTDNDAMCALYFYHYNFKLKFFKTFKNFLANLNFTLYCNLHDSVSETFFTYWLNSQSHIDAIIVVSVISQFQIILCLNWYFLLMKLSSILLTLIFLILFGFLPLFLLSEMPKFMLKWRYDQNSNKSESIITHTNTQ